jgi:ABC-type multidrug transport system fused ATPase/permease subunit
MSGKLTAKDIANLNIIVKVSSSLGFIGVCCMGFMLYRKPSSFRNPTGRLILAITFTDLMDSITKFIGRWGPGSGVNSPLCFAQAFSIQQFNIASVTRKLFFILVGLLLGLNALYLIYLKGSGEKIQKWEPYMILFAFLFPLPFSLTPMFYRPNNQSMVGDVDTWCWISRNSQVFQLYFWFLLLFIFLFLNILILIFTVIGIKRLESEEAVKDSSTNEKRKKRFGTFVIKRMMAYLIAFVVVWLPSSLNRITQLSAGTTVFVFAYSQSLISPMRGFINFLAYFYTWWYSSLKKKSSNLDSSINRSSLSENESPINVKKNVQVTT